MERDKGRGYPYPRPYATIRCPHCNTPLVWDENAANPEEGAYACLRCDFGRKVCAHGVPVAAGCIDCARVAREERRAK